MTKTRSLKQFGLLYGSSLPMEELYQQVSRVAATDATVLLIGESGTGKELVAQTLHRESPRCVQRFVAVNCGAIAPHLIEAALFGHERGSFTGADKQQVGYFEHASKGTLFLDEITEMPVEMQVKLLRVLECGRFHRVGGNEEVSVDVRLIAATNRELGKAVQEGALREDLMYRLAVFPIHVPPLRDRGDDVERLALHFLEELNFHGNTQKIFSESSFDIIRRYSWPGNVRELKNVVHRAFILAGNLLEIEEQLGQVAGHRPLVEDGCLTFPVGIPLMDAQREIILATLKHHQGNKRRTADTLGISLKTLYNRMREY